MGDRIAAALGAWRVMIAALVILAAAGPLPADAASAAVTIKSFAFQPQSVSVNAGESVTWTNADGISHSATSDTGAFDTGVFPSGSRTIVFPHAGTFAYHCAVHPGMHGTVVVIGPATPVPTPPPPAPATPPPAPVVTPTPAAVVESPSPVATPAASETSTPSPLASPTATIAPTPSAAATSTVALAAAPSVAATAGSRSDSGPVPVILGGAAVAIVAVLAASVYRARSR